MGFVTVVEEAGVDDGVVAAAGRGDADAIAALYRDLYPRLRRSFARFAPDDAADLASETWLALAPLLPTVTGGAEGVRRLAFTIARRRWIDLRRRASRRRTDPVDASDLAHRADPAADPSDLVADAFAASDALALLTEHLPEAWAEIVVLRVVAGLSAEAVGELVGKSAGAVRVTQHRALARLAERLEPGSVTP